MSFSYSTSNGYRRLILGFSSYFATVSSWNRLYGPQRGAGKPMLVQHRDLFVVERLRCVSTASRFKVIVRSCLHERKKGIIIQLLHSWTLYRKDCKTVYSQACVLFLGISFIQPFTKVRGTNSSNYECSQLCIP